MSFKKTILISSITALLGISLSVQAKDLVTVNNSDKPSTVMVNGICVGKLSGALRVVTPPHGSSSVEQSKVVQLCGGPRVHLCVANIHMTDNCSDGVVAIAKLNLDNFVLENPIMTPGVPFKIEKTSPSSVVINPA